MDTEISYRGNKGGLIDMERVYGHVKSERINRKRKRRVVVWTCPNCGTENRMRFTYYKGVKDKRFICAKCNKQYTVIVGDKR